MKDLKLEALKKRYEAQIAESKATLEVYLTNAAGIGDHPQIIDEMDKLVGKIESANGKLKVLETIDTSSEDYKRNKIL